MLKPLPMQHLNRPEISAFFGVRRGVPLKLIFEALRGYDPMIRPIGHYTFITDVNNLGAAITKLRAYVIDPNYHMLKAKADTKDPSGKTQVGELRRNLEDWEVVTEALAAGLYPSADRCYLSKAKFGAGDELLVDTLSSWMQQDVAFYDAQLPYPRILQNTNCEEPTPGQPESAAEKAFISSALALDWESLRTSGYLVNVPEAAAGVQRTSYERTMRALRITGAKVAYAVAWRVMSLRPYRQLLADPHIRARLILEFGPNATEYIAVLEEMAALPIHRWLAIADSITMPGRNLTPWGAGTVTFGIDASLAHALRAGAPDDQNCPNDPITTVRWPAVFEFARAMKGELRLLKEDEGLALDAAMAALRFSAVGPRPRIGLMGSERLPVHVDGVNATEALAPLDLIFRTLLPARKYGQVMPWIGEERVVQLSELEQLPRAVLWEEPETLPVVGQHVLGRLSPSQVRDIEEYQGEDDAIMTPTTIDGLAEMFGISRSTMERMIRDEAPGKQTGWSKWFAVDGPNIKTLDPTGIAYLSSRTRRLVQNQLEIPHISIDEVHALQYGYVVKTERLRSHFFRDLEVPTPTFDVADKIRSFAVDMISRR